MTDQMQAERHRLFERHVQAAQEAAEHAVGAAQAAYDLAKVLDDERRGELYWALDAAQTMRQRLNRIVEIVVSTSPDGPVYR